MTETIIAQRVLVRDLPDRSRIVARLQVTHLDGNAHPYFSATCDIYEPHGTWSGAARQRYGREMDGGGAAHEEILRAFPGAEPFVRMHLADHPSGEPLHALANALYFWRGRHESYYGPEYLERHGTGPERAARTLRVAVDELPDAETASDDDFAAFVDTLRPRWAQEAADAMELLERMPDLFALRGYDMRGNPVAHEPLPEWLTGTRDELVSV